MNSLGQTLEHSSTTAIFFLRSRNPFLAQDLSTLAMTASHPDMFKSSSIDEGELLKLVENHLLPNRVILQ
jgi:hypothetical protein